MAKSKMANLLKFIQISFSKIFFIIEQGAKKSEDRMIPFGIFGFLVPFSYYLLHLYLLPAEPYESLIPRSFMVALCVLLTLKDYWPKKLRPFLPIYWYVTVIYSMPFIITFMALKNDGASAWMMNLLSVVILTMLLVDWISYSIIMLLGVSLAWLAYYYTTSDSFSYDPGTLTYRNLIDTFVISIIMGVVFSRKKEKMEQEKLDAMKQLSANVAHELRTPLAAINAGTEGLLDYLPDLIESYDLAKKAGLAVPQINASEFKLLVGSLENIQEETFFSNTFINMLLVNFDHSKIRKINLKPCSINQCVDEALRRYPFGHGERKLVHWKKNGEFIFNGENILTVHILFNLLKNALYYIKVAKKGEITIWTEKKKLYNFLYFRDTGAGIPAKILPHIFERFFSQTRHGSGQGLAFCQSVMEVYGGKIYCKAKENEFTEFVLRFPLLESREIQKQVTAN